MTMHLMNGTWWCVVGALTLLGCSALLFGLIRKRKMLTIASALLLAIVGAGLVIDMLSYRTIHAYQWNVVFDTAAIPANGTRTIYCQDVIIDTKYPDPLGLMKTGFGVGAIPLESRAPYKTGGWIPVAISAKLRDEQGERTVSKTFEGLKAGSYVFTLRFNSDGQAVWQVEKVDDVQCMGCEDPASNARPSMCYQGT